MHTEAIAVMICSLSGVGEAVRSPAETVLVMVLMGRSGPVRSHVAVMTSIRPGILGSGGSHQHGENLSTRQIWSFDRLEKKIENTYEKVHLGVALNESCRTKSVPKTVRSWVLYVESNLQDHVFAFIFFAFIIVFVFTVTDDVSAVGGIPFLSLANTRPGEGRSEGVALASPHSYF